MKLASRLSALYAVLLGVTVLIVILASSIALVVELWRFSADVMIAKHEEARILVDQYRREGMSLTQAAPEIVNALGGIGLRVTVYDLKGQLSRRRQDACGPRRWPACSPPAACSILFRRPCAARKSIRITRAADRCASTVIAGRFHPFRPIPRVSSRSR